MRSSSPPAVSMNNSVLAESYEGKKCFDRAYDHSEQDYYRHDNSRHVESGKHLRNESDDCHASNNTRSKDEHSKNQRTPSLIQNMVIPGVATSHLGINASSLLASHSSSWSSVSVFGAGAGASRIARPKLTKMSIPFLNCPRAKVKASLPSPSREVGRSRGHP